MNDGFSIFRTLSKGCVTRHKFPISVCVICVNKNKRNCDFYVRFCDEDLTRKNLCFSEERLISSRNLTLKLNYTVKLSVSVATGSVVVHYWKMHYYCKCITIFVKLMKCINILGSRSNAKMHWNISLIMHFSDTRKFCKISSKMLKIHVQIL